MSAPLHAVDLMGDIARFSTGEPTMTVVHIVKTQSGYRVVQDDRMADGFAFDEMLGQVVDLLHPKLGHGRYRMMTRAEHLAEIARHEARVAQPEKP